MSLPHLIRHNVTVSVQRRSDVCMSHHFLLNSYRCSDRIKPRSVCVTKRVGAKRRNPRSLRCSLEEIVYFLPECYSAQAL